MSRGVVFIGICALLGALGCAGLLLHGGAVMPSYLSLWLFLIALPLGALPIVMTADLVGAGSVLLMVLRRMLLLIFPASLLAIPLMLQVTELYARPGGLPADWMAPHAFVIRMLVLLIVWCLLAAVFSAPFRQGRGRVLAMIGLLLHAGMASLAAIDWVMSLQPQLGSSAFGLLLIMAQMAIAASAALLVVSVQSPGSVPVRARVVLICVLVGWMFLHLTQYLVVWSANLPDEIVWYQLRGAGLGEAVIWMAVSCTVIALVMLPAAVARLPVVSACCGGMLLTVHLLEMLWLVTPVFRGGFLLNLEDALAVLGLGGIAALLVAITLPRNLPMEILAEGVAA